MTTEVQSRADSRGDIHPRSGVVVWTCRWVRHFQQELSDHLHAPGDELAYRQGWQITKSTGRFGFGVRTYRDPRFGTGVGSSFQGAFLKPPRRNAASISKDLPTASE